jgi:putative Holliday junction resolvase
VDTRKSRTRDRDDIEHYYVIVRCLGVDFGRRRIGLAVSDASAVLARPWRTLDAGDSARASAHAVVRVLADLNDPLEADAPVGAIVVGLPRRLDGRDNEATGPARALAEALRTLTGLPVFLQDERLTSREAERLLAEREPDWRRRKERLDAAAAAIILQDFLDTRAGSAAASGQAGA